MAFRNEAEVNQRRHPEEALPGLHHRTDTEIQAYTLFYYPLTERIVFPNQTEAEDRVHETIKNWEEKDIYWGLYTGCFDAIHPNHFWAIVRARIEVAKSYAASKGIDFDTLDSEEQANLVLSNHIALMISIDGDQHVYERKALKTTTGTSIRPVQNWGNRAVMVNSVMLPLEDGTYRPVADLIVAHDKYAYTNTMFQDQWALGRELKPNCWMVASTDSANADAIRALNIGTDVRNLPEGTIVDPFTDKPYSTSGQVERIVQSVLESRNE